LHELLVVFRYAVTGAGLGRKQYGAVRVRNLWGRSEQDFSNSCRAGVDKNFQPTQCSCRVQVL